MEFIFTDEAFKFETLRAAGFAADAGSDIGEVVVTTAQIPEGDEDAWTAAWKATAERTAQRGEDSLEIGTPSVPVRRSYGHRATTAPPSSTGARTRSTILQSWSCPGCPRTT